MKGVFFFLPILSLLLILPGGCQIPRVTFTFENRTDLEVVVTPRPDTGQDWSGFTLPANATATVKSESSNIFFTATMGGSDEAGYTTSPDGRTFIFENYPGG